MSDADGTCEYVLDPDDPETWGGEEGDECYADEEVLNQNGVWTCPHDAEEGKNLCIFHLSDNVKNDSQVVSSLLSVIRDVSESDNPTYQKRRQEFIGAEFGDVNIVGEYIPKTPFQIRFDYAEFKGEWTVEETVIHQELEFDYTIFRKGCIFSNVEFSERVRFRSIQFHDGLNIFDSNFGEEIEFLHCRFHNRSSFTRSVFDEEIIFSSSIFEDNVGFDDSQFKNGAKFSGVDRVGPTIFKDNVHFFRSDFRAKPDFGGCQFRGKTSFTNADVAGGNFREITSKGATFIFDGADLTDANFSYSDFSNSNFERAILSRAEFFDTNLQGSMFYGAILGDAQINDGTQFDEFCIYDPKSSDSPPPTNHPEDETSILVRAAGHYRALEQLARTNAFPDMVSHNFIRRQNIHREQHRQEGRWGRWLRATASKYVLEYGENPWRLIVTGLIIVVGFGLLYPLVGGLQPTEGSTITLSRTIDNPILLLQSIYYSTLTFTTLGMGDFLPVGLGRVLTTLETSLGAIIIALLVFVFGRRAAR
jgi:uncharacterized protein YjbI with pentapeptide repeats